MSDYATGAYKQQLMHKAIKDLGYNSPFQDQKTHNAITIAINEKVHEFAQGQQYHLNQMVQEIKNKL